MGLYRNPFSSSPYIVSGPFMLLPNLPCHLPRHFYTPPHDSGGVLWFHFGSPCVRPSVFRFQMITYKHQWIFTKLGICIDLVEIWFGIANGQISSNFDSYLPETRPYFRFRMITWLNIIWFLPNLVCAWILYRSGLGLLMDKFHQIFMELFARDTPIFSYLDDNLSKCQGIITKLGTCIDMKEILVGIANGQLWSMFDSYLPSTW